MDLAAQPRFKIMIPKCADIFNCAIFTNDPDRGQRHPVESVVFTGGVDRHVAEHQAIALPQRRVKAVIADNIAGQAGWVVAECGRQPWAIRDMLPTTAAISKLDVGSVQATFFIFLILFTVMLIAEIGIMVKAIKKGPEEEISNR